MIIVKFTSGLGNQMFQYSLYTYLRKKYPSVPVKADVTWFGRSSEHQGYELRRIFERSDNPQFVLEEASHLEILRLTGRYPNPHSGRLGDLWQNILKLPHTIIRMAGGDKYARMHIDQSGFEDNAEVYERIMSIDPAKDWYISGFYIEDVYYRDRLEEIRTELSFDTTFERDNGEYTRRIAERIKNCNAVSVHVRRGDYLSDTYNTRFISLSQDYYKEAVKRAVELYEDAVFFMFSDDKEFIEKEFGWIDELYPSEGGSRIVVVSGNSGSDSYRDMQLMSMCRVNITANSTFSTWAGLLNANRDAHIFYPKKYLREKDSEVKNIAGWERI